MRRVSHCIAGGMLSLVLVAGLGMPCNAQQRAPVPGWERQAAEAVANALQLDAAGVLASHLQLLRPPVTRPGTVHLRVVSIKAAGEGVWFLRLDCDSRRDCLPFYVLLRWSAIDAAILARAGVESDAGQQTVVAASDRRPSAPLQRSGDRVDMIEELSGMHLRTHAVCLQSGSLGDRIRVRNLSTHRVVLATVAGGQLVRVER